LWQIVVIQDQNSITVAAFVCLTNSVHLTIDRLSDVFHDFIENPETLDDDVHTLLTSLKRLRISLDIPDIHRQWLN
jgi:hypothetical protein